RPLPSHRQARLRQLFASSNCIRSRSLTPRSSARSFCRRPSEVREGGRGDARAPTAERSTGCSTLFGCIWLALGATQTGKRSVYGISDLSGSRAPWVGRVFGDRSNCLGLASSWHAFVQS